MKKQRHVVKKLLALGMAAILPVASGMTVRAEESDEASSDAGKEETVYVFTDANGNPQKTLVSNWLKNPDGSSTLTDTSDLRDITNVEGDETYTQSGNQLTWQADGSDIYYQGTSSKQAPVSVKLSYKLDGKDISADDLAGKSGHVTIRFDYENNATKNVTINGKNEEIKVPFAMVSGVVLPVDNFKNITVTNGRVLSEGKSNIVVGMAFPGLKESLNMDSASFKDNIGDYNIPEYVEISADATDFSLGMTLTVASTDVISQLKDAQDGKIDTSSITDSINELTDASQQLVDGTQQLKDGTAKLRTGTNDLTSGGGKLKDGAGELASGLNTFDATLKSNLSSTKASFAKDSAKAEADKDAIVKLLSGMGILNADGTVNQQTLNQLKTLTNMANTLINSGLLQEAGIMDSDGNLTADADARTTQLVNLLQVLNQSGALQALGLIKDDGTLDLAKLQEYLQMAAQYGSDLGLLDENGKVKPNAADIVNGYAAGIQQIMKDTGLLTADGKLADDAATKLANLDKMITDLKAQNVLVTDDTGALALNPTYAELLNNKALISLAQDKNLTNMLGMAENIGLIKAGKDDQGNDVLSIDQTALNNLSSIAGSGILVNGDLDATAKQLMGASGIIGADGKYNQKNAAALLTMLTNLKKAGLLDENGQLSDTAKAMLSKTGVLNQDGTINQAALAKLSNEAKLAAQLEAQGMITADGNLSDSAKNMLAMAQNLQNAGILTADGQLSDTVKKQLISAGVVNSDGSINQDTIAKLVKEAQLAKELEKEGMLTKDGDLSNSAKNMLSMAKNLQSAGLLTADGQLSDSAKSMLSKTGVLNADGSINATALNNIATLANSGIITTSGDLDDTAKSLMNETGIMQNGTYSKENAQTMLNMIHLLEKAGIIKDGQLTDLAKKIINGISKHGAKQNSFAVMEDEDAPAADTAASDQTAAAESDQTDDQSETVTPDDSSKAKDEAADTATDTDTAKTDDNSSAEAADTTTDAASTDDSAEVESLKKQLADAQSQLDAANAKANDLQSQLDTANASVSDLQSQLDAANAAKDDAYNQGYAAGQADANAAAQSAAPAADTTDTPETTSTAFVGSADDYVVSTASVSFNLDQVNQLKDLLQQFLTDYGQAAGEAGAVQALESILNNSDYQKLIAGGTTLSNGTNELYDGILKLRDGTVDLDDGAQELLDGMTEFDSEGIQKLADIFGNDLGNVIDRLDAVMDAGADYTSFTGSGNSNDSVKFVIKTSEVGSDSDD